MAVQPLRLLLYLTDTAAVYTKKCKPVAAIAIVMTVKGINMPMI